MEKDIVREMFENGGLVSYPQNRTILFYTAHNQTWHVLDKTLDDFLGDKEIDEVSGTQEFEDMYYYIASKWKEQIHE